MGLTHSQVTRTPLTPLSKLKYPHPARHQRPRTVYTPLLPYTTTQHLCSAYSDPHPHAELYRVLLLENYYRAQVTREAPPPGNGIGTSGRDPFGVASSSHAVFPCVHRFHRSPSTSLSALGFRRPNPRRSSPCQCGWQRLTRAGNSASLCS